MTKFYVGRQDSVEFKCYWKVHVTAGRGGAVQFSLQSAHVYPFSLCYFSVCRKTAGGGGFAINLGEDYQSLDIRGEDQLGIYQVTLTDAGTGKKA